MIKSLLASNGLSERRKIHNVILTKYFTKNYHIGYRKLNGNVDLSNMILKVSSFKVHLYIQLPNHSDFTILHFYVLLS
jgi:hypothetical protein